MLYIGICDDDKGVCAELEIFGTEERVCADF